MQIDEHPQLAECVDVQLGRGLQCQVLTDDRIKHPTRNSDTQVTIFEVSLKPDNKTQLFLLAKNTNDLHLAIEIRVETVVNPAAAELMSSVMTR